MEHLNDWYTQKGMKKVKRRMVSNRVPMEENIFSLVHAAKTPLKITPNKQNLPSASGVVRGREEPKPTIHTATDPDDTAHGIDPKGFGDAIRKLMKEAPNDKYTVEQFMGVLDEAGVSVDEGAREFFKDLIQRKLVRQTPEPPKPDFKRMTPTERREYMADTLPPHIPLDMLARRGNKRAIYALSEPLVEEINEYCPRCLMEVLKGQHPEHLGEAVYQGRTVSLGKPMRGDVKKFKVFVRDPKTGNIKKVNFGDKTMKIKKSNPARRRSFRARHHCDTNPGPRTKARYWSCRKW
jgi:hypothetical protein